MSQIVLDPSGGFMSTATRIRDNLLVCDLSRDDAPPEPIQIGALGGEVGAIAFAATEPDAPPQLLVGRSDGRLERWAVDPRPLVEAACIAAGRVLSGDEVNTFLAGTQIGEPPCAGP